MGGGAKQEQRAGVRVGGGARQERRTGVRAGARAKQIRRAGVRASGSARQRMTPVSLISITLFYTIIFVYKGGYGKR